MSKWMKQQMYVLKTQEGVIVRFQEQRPLEYKEPVENVPREPRKRRKDARKPVGD